jgi:DNA-binding MarR family transcriptional regulator
MNQKNTYGSATLEEELCQQISRCAGLMHRGRQNSREGILGTDSSRGQGMILRILLHHDGLAQRDLAAELDIRAASLGELIDKLQHQGLVSRRQNDGDKRVTNIFLTEEGKKMAREFEKARSVFSEGLFSELTDAEKQTLSVLLGKVVAYLS